MNQHVLRAEQGPGAQGTGMVRNLSITISITNGLVNNAVKGKPNIIY